MVAFASGGSVAEKTYISVKVASDVYRRVKTVANYRGLSIADCLSELADGPARRELAKILKETQGKGEPEP